MKTYALCLTAVMTATASGWPAPAVGQTAREPAIVFVAEFADPVPDAGKPAADPASPASEPGKVPAPPNPPAEPAKLPDPAKIADPAKLVEPAKPAKTPAGVVSGDAQVGCTPPAGAAGGNAFCPSITGCFDFLYMQRRRPNTLPLFNDPTGMTLLGASDFQFDYRPGADFGLTYNFCPDYGLDVRYLWLDEQYSDVTFAFPAGTSTIQTTPPSPFTASTAGTADFHDRSVLQTAEVLIRQHYNKWFDGLLGFRYVDFSDRLNGDYATTGGATATTAWNAQNNLFGLQLGASTLLWQNCRGLRIETYAKGGIYDNQAHTNMSATDSSGFATSAVAADSHLAFVGETGIWASYPVNCHVALRVGFQGLWLSGVAVATSQVQATAAITPPPQLLHANTNGDVFYQGVSGGVEVTW